MEQPKQLRIEHGRAEEAQEEEAGHAAVAHGVMKAAEAALAARAYVL